ncbi:cation:proton antiporter [Micromonospora sp. NPDC048999]|uniref:cation:proton antiporter n=1 Tax=Micromonospora sp. NPDC048999 TaxID=3155391 RepID=UPI00340E193D
MAGRTLATPPPSLTANQTLTFLLGLALLLGTAVVLGRLAERIGMPAIVGELLTGVILGPSLLGALAPGLTSRILPATATQMHLLDAVGQVGVLLLVAITGTHLDLAMLHRRRAAAITVSLSGLLIPLALGVAAGTVVPASLIAGTTERWVFALFLGVAMCVSAIPVIAKTLTDMRLLHRDIGQLTLAAGTVDDAVGWLLLSIVSAAATVGVGAGAISRSAAYLVAFLALAATAGRVLVRFVLTRAARSPQAGPTLAAVVVLVLVGAATTQALGMEATLGAFVVGILLGLPGTIDQAKLAPMRTVVLSILAPIFMATAGLRMDLTALRRADVAVAAAAILMLAVAGKFAGAYVGARLCRLNQWEALALGAGMNARGVVEVIIASVGLRLGVLSVATYTIVVAVAVVTSLMAPPVLRWAMRRIAENDQELLRNAQLASTGQAAGGREQGSDAPWPDRKKPPS